MTKKQTYSSGAVSKYLSNAPKAVSAYIAEIIQALTLFGALIAQFFFTYEIKEVENG